MKTTPATHADLISSVIAVPPLCRDSKLALSKSQNGRLIRHLYKGGIRTLLYGGNANLYNISVSEYERLLAMLADLGMGHDERGHLTRTRAHLDDVSGRNAVGRDVHLLAVHGEVTVSDQLTSHVAGLGEASAEHDVVEAGLEDLEQVLTSLARLALGFLEVVRELLLEHSVHTGRLLLLTQLQQVLAVLRAPTAVLARRVGPLLEGALRRIALGALEEQLHLLAAAPLAVGVCITRHVYLSPDFLRAIRRDDAWVGGCRCAAWA